MNLMETHHITGLKAKKIVFVMELPEAAKSIYQLSNANKPQNREMVLFSLMLQVVLCQDLVQVKMRNFSPF